MYKYVVLNNGRHGEEGCQISVKNADFVYGWSPGNIFCRDKIKMKKKIDFTKFDVHTFLYYLFREASPYIHITYL